MAAIHELLSRVEDEELRAKLEEEFNKLSKQKKFGLVFEEHIPECTPLYDIPIKRNSQVALKTGEVNDIYRVVKINGDQAECVHETSHDTVTLPVKDLVVVAKFGDPIYPCLKLMDSVCNAPDSDLWHTLIEADNYHALQLLEYLYAGKVDCIYIDPPYNTGAKDWKYNNDYVDGNDSYRHSKWLSMMQKRLKIAKRLLNPQDSVLICTIDEKEYLHLGCLLEEMFPEARIQMITAVINPSGSKRLNEFSRCDEYIFFAMLGDAAPCPINTDSNSDRTEIPWETFRRHDLQSKRGTSKGGTAQFYPIYVNDTTKKIIKIGEPLTPDMPLDSIEQISGCTPVFPIRDNGIEMNWGARPETARKLLNSGYLKIGAYKATLPQKYVVKYLTSGTIEDIESGAAVVDGYDSDGCIMAHYESGKSAMPKTFWDDKKYNANAYGSKILKGILGNRFDFPKSLYAVHDTIRFFVANKPNALILDFFAGSGTTLHAVNLLNSKDSGSRRCIMVTNNEVSVEESKHLSESGFSPGDSEWEKFGIARYVNWPRTVCSIEGHDISGRPLKGDYLDCNISMADGFKANAVFFKLGFLDKNAVAMGNQFKEILSTLWMKAGGIGACPVIEDAPDDMLILPNNSFAVLLDEMMFSEFAQAMTSYPDIRTIFFITDSGKSFREMSDAFPQATTYQLYRDYLDNFRINIGR